MHRLGKKVCFNLFGNLLCNAMNMIFGNDGWFNFRCHLHNFLWNLSSFCVSCDSSTLCALSSKLKGVNGSMSSSVWFSMDDIGFSISCHLSFDCSIWEFKATANLLYFLVWRNSSQEPTIAFFIQIYLFCKFPPFPIYVVDFRVCWCSVD